MPGAINPKRSKSVASSSATLQGALVEKARVITVNTRDYTCDVATEFTQKTRFDIPFMVPYCNQNQGEGINFMPEVGSTCWICAPSEGGRDHFILGWAMVDEGGAYRGGREQLNSGDIHFSTRDGNFLHLRRGGIVQIGATPICQRVYIPIRNIMQDFAENYELHTPGGDMTWTVARKDEDADGHQRCTWALGVKEFADDPNEDPIGVLKFGSHGEGNETILSLVTRDKGGGAVQTCLEINKAGEVTWNVKKLTFESAGDVNATIKGLFKLMAIGAVDIQSVASINVAAPAITLAAAGMTLALGGGGAALTGPSPISLGDGASFPAVRASPDLAAWIGAVTAILVGPPGPPAPVLTVGPTIFPPVLHTSPKVKL